MRRMIGRASDESHRVATPLELLFDLTFVVAFGIASAQAAHLLAEGHFLPAIGGFGFAMFAVVFAWINFSWFASAFDTDDWFYRVTTLVQMVGVIVLALGLPAMFHSLDEGLLFDNTVMVAGYVVMRVAMLAQWLRVVRQDPEHRTIAKTMALFIALAQTGWVVLLFLRELPWWGFVPCLVVVLALDLGGPIYAEFRKGGTPWHPHHIAERYGLLVIIALGEVIFGTIATVSAAVGHQGWSADAIVLVVAGLALAFGMWWVYFILPAGVVLSVHRERGFGWGYSHILLYASIAGTGAGLHVAGYLLEGEGHISTQAAVLTVAVPVLVFLVMLYGIYTYLVHAFDGPLHLALLAGGLAALVLAVVLAGSGVGFSVCLIIVALAPIITVVGYETVGHRHEAIALERMR
jgi:low temperature requirement protein LtrA